MTRDIIPWRKKRDSALTRETANPITELHRQMDDLFDSFFSGFGTTRWPLAGQSDEAAWLTPSIDVAETDDEITVTADLPGLDEKDLQITLDNGVLTVRGEKKREHEEKKKNYHMVERAYGQFHREIPLPASIEPDRVKAKFNKGVLNIAIPKKPEAKSKERKIEITSE